LTAAPTRLTSHRSPPAQGSSRFQEGAAVPGDREVAGEGVVGTGRAGARELEQARGHSARSHKKESGMRWRRSVAPVISYSEPLTRQQGPGGPRHVRPQTRLAVEQLGELRPPGAVEGQEDDALELPGPELRMPDDHHVSRQPRAPFEDGDLAGGEGGGGQERDQQLNLHDLALARLLR
jgi:hypothetical protein